MADERKRMYHGHLSRGTEKPPIENASLPSALLDRFRRIEARLAAIEGTLALAPALPHLAWAEGVGPLALTAEPVRFAVNGCGGILRFVMEISGTRKAEGVAQVVAFEAGSASWAVSHHWGRSAAGGKIDRFRSGGPGFGGGIRSDIPGEPVHLNGEFEHFGYTGDIVVTLGGMSLGTVPPDGLTVLSFAMVPLTDGGA